MRIFKTSTQTLQYQKRTISFILILLPRFNIRQITFPITACQSSLTHTAKHNILILIAKTHFSHAAMFDLNAGVSQVMDCSLYAFGQCGNVECKV